MLRLNKEYGIQIASFINGNVHLLMPSSHTSSIMVITIAPSLRKDETGNLPRALEYPGLPSFIFLSFFSNQLIILMFTYVSYFYNS